MGYSELTDDGLYEEADGKRKGRHSDVPRVKLVCVENRKQERLRGKTSKAFITKYTLTRESFFSPLRQMT